MTDTRMQANQVPLVERLRSVPANAHLAVNTPNPLEHDTQHFAIGAMCHQAAARLAALEAELDRAFDELGMLGVPRERARTVANGINVLMTRISKSESAMLSELEEARRMNLPLAAMWLDAASDKRNVSEMTMTDDKDARIAALEMELEAAKRDADRVLRTIQKATYICTVSLQDWQHCVLEVQRLADAHIDAAIDAARKERT